MYAWDNTRVLVGYGPGVCRVDDVTMPPCLPEPAGARASGPCLGSYFVDKHDAEPGNA